MKETNAELKAQRGILLEEPENDTASATVAAGEQVLGTRRGSAEAVSPDPTPSVVNKDLLTVVEASQSTSTPAPDADVLQASELMDESQPPPNSTPNPVSPSTEPDDDSPPPLPPSPAEQRWERQKDTDDKENTHIDAIMAMTALENVKQQVLRIQDKIEVSKRQETSVKDERFSIVLLGNPGTGESWPETVVLSWVTVGIVQGKQRLQGTMRSS